MPWDSRARPWALDFRLKTPALGNKARARETRPTDACLAILAGDAASPPPLRPAAGNWFNLQEAPVLSLNWIQVQGHVCLW